MSFRLVGLPQLDSMVWHMNWVFIQIRCIQTPILNATITLVGRIDSISVRGNDLRNDIKVNTSGNLKKTVPGDGEERINQRLTRQTN